MGTKEGVFRCHVGRLRTHERENIGTHRPLAGDASQDHCRLGVRRPGRVPSTRAAGRHRADGKGECKGKVRRRQRVETQEAAPHHPELDGAYKLLMNPESFKKLKFSRQSVSAGAL